PLRPSANSTLPTALPVVPAGSSVFWSSNGRWSTRSGFRSWRLSRQSPSASVSFIMPSILTPSPASVEGFVVLEALARLLDDGGEPLHDLRLGRGEIRLLARILVEVV